jgi:SAM-dependent methyltransferase
LVSQEFVDRFYGDPKFMGTQRYYALIRPHVTPQAVVLNLGAGPATRRPDRHFHGQAKRIVGADIDPVVLENDEVDEAVVIDGKSLPFEDNCFDVVYCDFVLEHVEFPQPLFDDVHRVLKPGGNFFFRTPNFTHYVALGSYMTPQWVHERFANRMRGLDAEAHDPWPTFYRANTPGTIRRLARKAGFAQTHLELVETEPSYLKFHPAAFLVGVAYERLVNSTPMLAGLRASIFGRLVKAGG